MAKIHNWSPPKDHNEVLQFLRLVEYLACFMPNVCAFSSPLQTICNNHLPFVWTPLHQKCFKEIKTIACKTPILKPIVWDIPPSTMEENKSRFHVWVVTDACPAGMGAVLTQGEDWQTAHPTAFMSKKFTLTQHTYFAYELEALGILEPLSKCLVELPEGGSFTLVTHHKVLTYF